MNLVFVGCEYAGKSTIAAEVMEWAMEILGGTSHFHDHFTVPSSEFSPAARESLKQAHPQVIESFQRYMIEYHVHEHFYRNPDHNLMGVAIEEAVYAPRYYGYGGKDSGAPQRSPEGQRTEMARRIEENMLRMAPGTVLVLFKASPEVIAGRMREDPHPHQIVREGDIERVLERFEEEFAASLITRRIVLDTTDATVAETLAEFVEQYEPLHTAADRQRIQSHLITYGNGQAMIPYEEFLRTAAVPRETIDRFLAEDQPTWARFDPEVGYTLGRYLPRDGLDGSWTVSTAQDNGQRTSWIYADRPCRINTYGNSFTQCHQVSDGETWQEYLAAHLGEPVRNFGMGGFGTYQAYRRMRRAETGDLSARYAILYIWGDDHCRSIMRSRHAATHRVWDDHNGYMFHGNFWANVEFDLDAERFVERDSLLTTPEALYRMCDSDFMIESLRDDLMVMLYGMERFEVEGDADRLNRLTEHLGVPGIDGADADARMASVAALKHAYGFAASRYIAAEARSFLAAHDKELLVCLLCPTATDQLLRGQPRYDQTFADHLREEGFRVFDMNEVHYTDFQAFNLSVDDYRQRYWIGHYSPAGNHFFAYSLKDSVVEWLDPKPISYRGEAMSSADFAGYLPDVG